jgi:hypothetical protein
VKTPPAGPDEGGPLHPAVTSRAFDVHGGRVA